MKIKLELIMDLDTDFENSLEAVKELEHHADWLLDLDEWPEIRSVSNCKVTIIKQNNTEGI